MWRIYGLKQHNINKQNILEMFLVAVAVVGSVSLIKQTSRPKRVTSCNLEAVEEKRREEKREANEPHRASSKYDSCSVVA